MSRSLGGKLFMFFPSISICPDVGCSSPAIIHKIVDLPDPDGPTRTTNSPSCTFRLML